jgi:hypothetical protein
MPTPATGVIPVIPPLVRVIGRLTCAHGLPVTEPRSTVGFSGIVVVVAGTEVVVVVGSTVVVVDPIAVVVVVGAIVVVVGA